MLPIQKMLINVNYSKGVVITPKYIVIHETDNVSKGANAIANRNYFANHSEAQASTHYVVDDHSIIQCLENNQKGWHVGVLYGKPNVPDANNGNTIGIEICVNADGDYTKARQNTIELVKYLMQILHIPASNVISHYDVCVKHCPRKMLDNPALWQDFKNQISGQAPIVKPAPAPAPNTDKIYGVVTASVLNVRAGRGTQYAIIGQLKKGDKIRLDKQFPDGWYSIYYATHGGFVSGTYIQRV